MKNFNDFLDDIEQAISSELARIKPLAPTPLYDAIDYALSGGGKRVRPMLMLLTADALDLDGEKIIRIAVALECIHTYSLIHDDLPSMDDDDYRRGRLAVHKVFGEAMAILAGDALLNLAYEILLDESVKDASAAKAALYIARAAGAHGMLGGQTVDITAKSYTKDELAKMYAAKTGALISAAMVAPYMVAAKADSIDMVAELAGAIGLIFQIVDDLLDDKEGGDIGKTTFVSLVGRAEALHEVAALDRTCKRLFGQLGLQNSQLCEYTLMLSHRLN